MRRRSRKHIQMQRSRFDGFGPALAQAIEMPLGGGQLGVAQRCLLGKEFARFVDVAGHEDAECDPQRIHRAFVEGGEFFRAFR